MSARELLQTAAVGDCIVAVQLERAERGSHDRAAGTPRQQVAAPTAPLALGGSMTVRPKLIALWIGIVGWFAFMGAVIYIRRLLHQDGEFARRVQNGRCVMSEGRAI